MGGVGADWLKRTDAAVERLSDDLTTIDVRTATFLLREFAEALEGPPDALHAAVLSAILMDVCGRVVHTLHQQNPVVSCTCDATIWSHVSRFTKWREGDPRLAFRDWLQTFFASVEQQHPSDGAVRAARIIRNRPATAWTLAVLAEAADTRPSALRRDFAARFGLRPSAYVHLARTIRAISLLRTSAKVEAVAWEVGYRSKKDLYAALSRWAGATPTELRSISDDECEGVLRELKVYALRGGQLPAVPGHPPIGASNRRGAGTGGRRQPIRRSASPLNPTRRTPRR